MLIVTKAGSENEHMDPYPEYALIKIDQRTIDRASYRIQELCKLREDEPHFLKAHFTDMSVLAWFSTGFCDEAEEGALGFATMLEKHDFSREPVIVLDDSFKVPGQCEIVEHHLETMLCYTDEFSFRAASAGSNTPLYVDTMLDPGILQGFLDGSRVQKEAA